MPWNLIFKYYSRILFVVLALEINVLWFPDDGVIKIINVLDRLLFRGNGLFVELSNVNALEQILGLGMSLLFDSQQEPQLHTDVAEIAWCTRISQNNEGSISMYTHRTIPNTSMSKFAHVNLCTWHCYLFSWLLLLILVCARKSTVVYKLHRENPTLHSNIMITLTLPSTNSLSVILLLGFEFCLDAKKWLNE